MSTRVKATLEGKDYAGLVTGEERGPEETEKEEHADYVRNFRKARAILVNALGDKPLRHVQNCNSPAEMWAKLRER